MQKSIIFAATCLVGCLTLAVGSAPAAEPTGAGQAETGAARNGSEAVRWLSDYGQAMREAERGRKMLLIYFYELEPTENQRRLEQQSLADPRVAEHLKKGYVAVRLPTNTEVSVGGKVGPLMDHEAFADLRHKAGLAVVDYVNQDDDYYGYVVSILPIQNGKYYRFSADHLRVLLELPEGSLTQRTMIFAVRIHPEKPESTRGRPSRTLFSEARNHSQFQARLRLQGHHNWGARFKRITNLLPFGLRAQEVVAESWPGESLVDAAVDCVDCWRQSPGHWSAVQSDQPQFGYDMEKGANGIWYATGLFGNRE
jgi:hypothetical protein